VLFTVYVFTVYYCVAACWRNKGWLTEIARKCPKMPMNAWCQWMLQQIYTYPIINQLSVVVVEAMWQVAQYILSYWCICYAASYAMHSSAAYCYECSVVYMPVCVSVGHERALQKRKNRWRCFLCCAPLKNYVLGFKWEVEISHSNGTYWGHTRAFPHLPAVALSTLFASSDAVSGYQFRSNLLRIRWEVEISHSNGTYWSTYSGIRTLARGRIIHLTR